MRFPDVIGQQAVVTRLAELLQGNRLSHAILLLGKEGSGVLPIAMNFAQWVVSLPQEAKTAKGPEVADLFGGFTALPAAQEDNTVPGIPAEMEPSAAQMLHPDLHFSYPVITKKAGDKPISTDYIREWRDFYRQMPYGNAFDWLQSINAENRQGNITAEECNDIIRKLSLKTFKARFKVLLMWMPEYLGKEGNKLLKLIEEPPPDTLFLLAAESEEQLLPTIVSRCQVIRVPPLAENDIAEALEERARLSPEQARQLAMVCDGNYREALQLLQHNEEDWNGLLIEWMTAMLLRGGAEHKKYEAQNKVVGTLSAMGREKQKQLLRYFLQLIEISIRIRLIGEDRLQLAQSERDFALRLNKLSGLGQQRAIAEEIEKAIYYIERNANAKILFHALTIKLRYIVLDKMVLTS
jgi:DNA polymerase-3 subunit delta'